MLITVPVRLPVPLKHIHNPRELECIVGKFVIFHDTSLINATDFAMQCLTDPNPYNTHLMGTVVTININSNAELVTVDIETYMSRENYSKLFQNNFGVEVGAMISMVQIHDQCFAITQIVDIMMVCSPHTEVLHDTRFQYFNIPIDPASKAQYDSMGEFPNKLTFCREVKDSSGKVIGVDNTVNWDILRWEPHRHYVEITTNDVKLIELLYTYYNDFVIAVYSGQLCLQLNDEVLEDTL